jgi:hypothetical protein
MGATVAEQVVGGKELMVALGPAAQLITFDGQPHCTKPVELRSTVQA